MPSSAKTPPEFWSTIQRHGPTGTSYYNWRHRAGSSYSLLKPFLHAWPEPLVCTMLCPHCHRIRRITNPYEDVFILEQPGDCDDCESDRSIKREDLQRTSLNGLVFVGELGKALEYSANPLPEQLPPASLIQMGSVRHNGLSLPVVMLLTSKANGVNLDSVFPSQEPRVVLHLDMEEALITALQHRRLIPVHLPSLVRPVRGGTFAAQMTLAEILAGAPATVANESMLVEIHQELQDMPHRMAAVLGTPPLRKRRYNGLITEPTFTADGGFRLICYQGITYRLGEKAGCVLMVIYHYMKELRMTKVPQDTIMDEVYGEAAKKSKKNISRVNQLFRTGDASRLWKTRFIDHDNCGNFFLTPLTHA